MAANSRHSYTAGKRYRATSRINWSRWVKKGSAPTTSARTLCSANVSNAAFRSCPGNPNLQADGRGGRFGLFHLRCRGRVGRVHEKSDGSGRGHQIVKQLQPLGDQSGGENSDAGGVAAGLVDIAVRPQPMSQLGQSRRFGHPAVTIAVGTRVTSRPPRTDPYGPNSGIRLVWGFLCQGGVTPFWSSFAFHSFVRPAPRAFFRPDRHIAIAVARSGGQGRRFFSAAQGLSLTGASTAAGWRRSSGWSRDDPRGACHWPRSIARTTLVFG